MPLTQAEEAELEDLEFQRLSAERTLAMQEAQAQQSPAQPNEAPAATGVAPAPQTAPPTVLSDLDLAKRTWQNATGPMDRLKAMILAAPAEVGKQVSNVVNLGARAGLPAAGQAIGAAMPMPFLSEPVLGGIGGMAGEAIAEAREGQGIHPGAILGAGVVGAVPGSPLEGAGAKQVAKAAAKYAAGNIAGKAVQTTVDQGRLPTLGESALAAGSGALGAYLGSKIDTGANAAGIASTEAQNATRDATLEAGRAAGYVVPVSEANPNAITKMLDTIAGRSATAQQAAVRNQEVTNALARKAIGLPPDAPITAATLKAVREQAAQPYQEISDIASKAKQDLEALQQITTGMTAHDTEAARAIPENAAKLKQLQVQAGADVDALRQARFEANANYRYYERSADPDALTRAKAADKTAAVLESKIDQAVTDIGRPDLLAQLKQGRERIAKVYDIERALNLGDSNVSAPILGQSLERGRPLTGELRTVAQMEQAFPQVMRERALVPSAQVTPLQVAAGIGTTLLGNHLGGVGGTAVALTPLGPYLARKATLSPIGQYLLAKPRYALPRPDFAAQAAMLGAQSMGRNPSGPLAFYTAQ